MSGRLKSGTCHGSQSFQRLPGVLAKGVHGKRRLVFFLGFARISKPRTVDSAQDHVGHRIFGVEAHGLLEAPDRLAEVLGVMRKEGSEVQVHGFGPRIEPDGFP